MINYWLLSTKNADPKIFLEIYERLQDLERARCLQPNTFDALRTRFGRKTHEIRRLKIFLAFLTPLDPVAKIRLTVFVYMDLFKCNLSDNTWFEVREDIISKLNIVFEAYETNNRLRNDCISSTGLLTRLHFFPR